MFKLDYSITKKKNTITGGIFPSKEYYFSLDITVTELPNENFILSYGNTALLHNKDATAKKIQLCVDNIQREIFEFDLNEELKIRFENLKDAEAVVMNLEAGLNNFKKASDQSTLADVEIAFLNNVHIFNTIMESSKYFTNITTDAESTIRASSGGVIENKYPKETFVPFSIKIPEDDVERVFGKDLAISRFTDLTYVPKIFPNEVVKQGSINL